MREGWRLNQRVQVIVSTGGRWACCSPALQPSRVPPDPPCPHLPTAECIPGYPDANLPTVLLYRDAKCAQTLVGLRQFGGRGTSPEMVSSGWGVTGVAARAGTSST